jgi:hypothetical protein
MTIAPASAKSSEVAQLAGLQQEHPLRNVSLYKIDHLSLPPRPQIAACGKDSKLEHCLHFANAFVPLRAARPTSGKGIRVGRANAVDFDHVF